MLTGLDSDEYFQRSDSGAASDLLADALGSTLALTDSSGALQTSYTYDPFGNTTTSGALSTNSFQFTGRENDGTGLYYYRARYMSPAMGRFISEDPIGLRGGNLLYGYADGDPISMIDPLGLWTGQFGISVNIQIGSVVVPFSGGIAFDGNRFVGNGVTAPAFSYLREIRTENEGLVDLTGIEPVTS